MPRSSKAYREFRNPIARKLSSRYNSNWDNDRHWQLFKATWEAAIGQTEGGYDRDPIGFARDRLGVAVLTSEQEDILLSIRDSPITNVQAGHGVGKSFVAAIAVLWWVFAVGGMAVTTAPTEDQVKQILWHEIRKLHARNKDKLGGKCDILQLYKSETARAYGFTSRDYDSNSFQGKHGVKLLLIQDEACGITSEIDDGFEACLTGSENRGLRIGNPIAQGNPFEESCRVQGAIKIPVWSHPNVAWAYDRENLKPEIARLIQREDGAILPQSQWEPAAIAGGILRRDLIPGAVSLEWIERIRTKKKPASAYWLTRLNACFPVDSERSIIPRSYFLAARERYDSDPQKWDAIAAEHSPRYGVDVGDTSDPHAIARWQGPVLYGAKSYPVTGDRQDTMRLVGTIKRQTDKASAIACDQIGVGAGTLARLLEEGYDARAANWGGAALDKGQYLNKKAEDFWLLRELLETEELAIAPLGEYEDEAIDDLAAIYYEEMPTGKIRIEAKTKTKKRLKRSPNCGDAIVIGFWAELGANSYGPDFGTQ